MIEIKSIFNNKIKDEQIIIDHRNNIISIELELSDEEIINLQNKLGWTIKISKKVEDENSDSLQSLINNLLAVSKKNKEWKLRIWINSFTKRVQVKKLLMWAKREIKSIRFLNNNFKNIESIVTKKQILDKNWIELNIIEIDTNILVSKTISVQDIESYSERDFQKPKRDARVWMLPPKLAQILINLSWAKDSIWDPFCGLWVIPIEAHLMWLTKIVYSDLHQEMVESTQKNLEWLKDHHLYKNDSLDIAYESFVNDVCNFKNVEVSTVVSEWYLWMPISNFAWRNHIEITDNLLSNIWKHALENFSENKIKTLVFCLPAFAQESGKIEFLRKTLEIIKQSKYTLLDLSDHLRRTLLYRKNNQFVYREILKLELTN